MTGIDDKNDLWNPSHRIYIFRGRQQGNYRVPIDREQLATSSCIWASALTSFVAVAKKKEKKIRSRGEKKKKEIVAVAVAKKRFVAVAKKEKKDS